MADKSDFVDSLRPLGDKVVAGTGQEKDRHHVGRLLIKALKAAGDNVMQIDGSTGASMTGKALLEGSVRCAAAFRALGLSTGDLIILSSPITRDTAVPFYAAMYLGIVVLAENYKNDEKSIATMERDFKKYKPKLVICQEGMVECIKAAIERTSSIIKLISYDDCEQTQSLRNFLDQHGTDANVDNFVPADFDPEQTTCVLAKSSGTTGGQKAAALSHKNVVTGVVTFFSWQDYAEQRDTFFVIAVLGWVSSLAYFICSPFYGYKFLYTSKVMTHDHFCELLTKYRPKYTCVSPPFYAGVLKLVEQGKVDITCIDTIMMGGCPVSPSLIEKTKQLAPNVKIFVGYGMTETSGLSIVDYDPMDMALTPLKHIDMQLKLVKADTGEEITEPDVIGELWVKSPNIFQGYYKDPELTNEVLTPDGWLKSGDMMKRTKQGKYVFAERAKMILKYYDPKVLERHYVLVSEIEEVIRSLSGVVDVAVTGVPSADCGDLVTACVVREEGSCLTAQQIKDHVQSKMEDQNRLRGGVIFLSRLPTLPTTKIDRLKIKEIAITTPRE